MTVLEISLRLLIFIAVGFVARKVKVIPEGFSRMFTKFVMAVPLPCMIINSFNVEYSVDNLTAAPIVMGLAVGSMLVMFGIATLLTLRVRDRDMRRTARFALLFTNFTLIGIPVVSEIYGAQGAFLYVVFTLPIRFMFYGGAAVMLGKGGEKLNFRETVKKFICAPVVAVIIGFLLYVTQLPVPNVIRSALSSLGSMASPLGLILCGVIIAEADLRQALRYPIVIWVSLARLILMPALALGLFLLVGVSDEIARTTMFYFAMPVASFLPTFLLRYNPEAEDARLAGGCMVVLSTLLCVATIPLWTIVLDKIL